MLYTHRVEFNFLDGHLRLGPRYIDPRRLRFTNSYDAVSYARQQAQESSGPVRVKVLGPNGQALLFCVSDGNGRVSEKSFV